MNLQSLVLLVLKTSIVLSVFALGLEAAFAHATYLFRRPRELGRAFLSMNVLMPLLAVILVMTLDLHPAVKIALAALSVSPCSAAHLSEERGPEPENRRCAVGYLLSPIQLIPTFIPVIGQLDDLAVLFLGIKLLRKWTPEGVLAECEARARSPVFAQRTQYGDMSEREGQKSVSAA